MARHKMMHTEYMVSLGTFAAIHVGGIEMGMVAGVLLAMVGFVLAYAHEATATASGVGWGGSGGGGGVVWGLWEWE